MPNDLLIPYRKKDKWGFYSSANKKIVIPCNYLNASVFSNVPSLKQDLAIVEDNALAGKYQFYIHRNGENGIKLKQKHFWLTEFSANKDLCFAKVAIKKFAGVKTGTINEHGQYIAKCEYEDCGMLADGDRENEKILPVNRNQKWGVISSYNERIFPFIFDHIYNYTKEGFAVCIFGLNVNNATVKSHNKNLIKIPEAACFGFIDNKGYIVNQQFFYKSAKSFAEGFAAVQKPVSRKLDETGKWGFINIDFEEITQFVYEDARSFSNGLAAVQQNGKWGFINADDKCIIEFKYENALSFSSPETIDGVAFAAVQQNGKWGFIDKEGNEVIECIYQKVYSFSNNIAAVCVNNKWGFIDKHATLIIPCKYDWIAEKQNRTNSFNNAPTQRLDNSFLVANGLLIKVSLNKKMGFIDTAGNEYWEN